MPDQDNAAGGDAANNATPENKGTGQEPNDAPENKGVNQDPKDQQPENKGTIEIPKDKWDQMYARNKKSEDRVKEFEEKERAQKEEAAIKNGEYQGVIDGLKTEKTDLLTKANSLEAMEGTLQKYLDTELAKVDETKRGLIPENFSTQERLDYIIKNQAFLYSAEAKASNATPTLPKSEDEMALNELEKAKNRLKELRDKRDQTGHLTAIEGSEVSKLARMISAAS